jgi:hypothetical protein
MSITSSNTVAKQIANDLQLSGSYWPFIIQALIGLSQPARRALEDYLLAQKAYYNRSRDVFNYLAQKGDTAGNKIAELATLLNEVAQPLKNFFTTFPIDSALKEIPEFSEMLGDLSANVPLQIPATTASLITGLAGFDLLEGVSSFRDLNDKLEELIFRAARATSLSNYSSKATYIVDNQVDKIDNLINILETLNYQEI